MSNESPDLYDGLDAGEALELSMHLALGGRIGVPPDYEADPEPPPPPTPRAPRPDRSQGSSATSRHIEDPGAAFARALRPADPTFRPLYD